MYDAIIVGARCAGSPLAMLLARKGHRVLAVDRSTFPSDIMSTHYIQPDGVQRLQAWGLYDRVMATNCPAIPTDHLPPRRRADAGTAGPVDARRDLPAPHRAGQDPRRCGAGRRRRGPRGLLGAGDPHRGRRRRRPARPQQRRRDRRGARARDDRRRRPPLDRRARRQAPRSTTRGRHTRAATTRTSAACRCRTARRRTLATRRACWRSRRTTASPASAPARRTTPFHEYRDDIEGTFYRLVEKASPAFAERVRAGKREERWMGTADTRELLPPAVRPRLGALRRRRLSQGLRHRPRHRGRVPRRGVPVGGAARRASRAASRSTTRWPRTRSGATKQRSRCTRSRCRSRSSRRCSRWRSRWRRRSTGVGRLIGRGPVSSGRGMRCAIARRCRRRWTRSRPAARPATRGAGRRARGGCACRTRSPKRSK